MMSDYLFGRSAGESTVAAALYRLVPNWQHFWVVDALAEGGTVPWPHVLGVALYAAVYTAGVLCLGVASFRHAEIA